MQEQALVSAEPAASFPDGGGGGDTADAAPRASASAPPSADADDGIAFAGPLLRLEDSRLERDYWHRHAAAEAAGLDWISCIAGVVLQAILIRMYLRMPPEVRAATPPLVFAAPHLAHLALVFAQGAALMLAPATYRRHRARVAASMCALRICFHVYDTILSRRKAEWWRARLATDAAGGPAQALGVILGLPANIVAEFLLNPCPSAALPLFNSAFALLFLRGWIPVQASVWRTPGAAGAAAALCARMRTAVEVVMAVTFPSLGWLGPAVSADAQACDAAGGCGDGQRCGCLLAVLSTAVFLAIALALPSAVTWRSEWRSKRAFLLTQALRLRLRAPWPAHRFVWGASDTDGGADGRVGHWMYLFAGALVLAWVLAQVLVRELAAGADWRAACA